MNLMQGTMDECRFEYIEMKLEKRDIKNSIHVSILFLFHCIWSIESGAGNNGNTLYVYDLKKKLKE